MNRFRHSASILAPAALLALALFAASYDSRQNPPNAISTKDASGNNQGASNRSHASLEEQPATDGTNYYAENKPAQDSEQHKKWGPTEWSATVQAASAALVAVFTFFLVWYSHRGWTEAKKSADAATKSANAVASNTRQDLVTELGNRAYLSVGFFGARYQAEGVWFEGEATINNFGSTPAYEVSFASAIAIVPFPIPEDFAFPLGVETRSGSISFIAPNMPTKTISRTMTSRVPDEQVQEIKHVTGDKALLMWGRVDYKDAFKRERFVRFAFIIHWVPWLEGKGLDDKGNPKPEIVKSADTKHHNDAN